MTSDLKSLLGRSAIYVAISRFFRRNATSYQGAASTAPEPWRTALLLFVDGRDDESYAVLLGGTGACPDGEVYYRASNSSGTILADIAGFYNAFGFPLPVEGDEKPDHVSSELEFVGFLYAKEAHALHAGNAEAAEVTREARLAFLRDHLALWIASFATALEETAPGSAYAAVGALAAQAVGEEVPLEAPQPPGKDEEPEIQCQGEL